MGLFGKLFGGYEARKDKADGLFERGQFGPAKLAYENALGAAPEPDRASLEARVVECCDGIAEGRIAEAERQLAQEAPDLAQLELEGALEVAIDPELRAEARRLLDSLEREDAQREVPEEEVLGDDAVIALLAGQWEETQGAEYDRLGEPLFAALVNMHQGEYEAARETLEALVSEAKIARYLWLELARARLMLDDDAGATEAFTTFLESLDPDEGGEARLSAHVELARLQDAAGDFEAAMAHLGDAVDAFEGDPRPYFLMGNFLRQKELFDEAVDVLRSAAAVMDEPLHPYSRALVSAIPVPGRERSQRIVLAGELPSPANPPSGCPFHTRCPNAMDICRQTFPALHQQGARSVYCHLYDGKPEAVPSP